MGPRGWTSSTSLPSPAADLAALAVWSQSGWPGHRVYSLEVQGPPEAWDLVGKHGDRMCWLLPVSFGDSGGSDSRRNKLPAGPSWRDALSASNPGLERCRVRRAHVAPGYANSTVGSRPWEDVRGKLEEFKAAGVPEARSSTPLLKQLFSNVHIKVTWAASVRQGHLPRPPDCTAVYCPSRGARGLGRDPARGSKGTILKLLLMFINRVLPRIKLAAHRNTVWGGKCLCSQPVTRSIA